MEGGSIFSGSAVMGASSSGSTRSPRQHWRMGVGKSQTHWLGCHSERARLEWDGERRRGPACPVGDGIQGRSGSG